MKQAENFLIEMKYQNFGQGVFCIFDSRYNHAVVHSFWGFVLEGCVCLHRIFDY